MTQAQKIKKIIKPYFENVRATQGKGTASGWVDVSFNVKKQEVCSCEMSTYGRCYECSNTIRTAQQRVYELIKGISLSTYCSDDGYGTERDCMIVSVNLV